MQQHVLIGETRVFDRSLSEEELETELTELLLAYLGVRENARVQAAPAG
jgi:hypothetical protein